MRHFIKWFGRSAALGTAGYRVNQVNDMKVIPIHDVTSEYLDQTRDEGSALAVRQLLSRRARSGVQDQAVVLWRDMGDFGTLSKADSYDANVRWLGSRPWIRVVTAQQVADNQINYVGQDGNTYGTWGTEDRGTGKDLKQTAKDYVDWATGESYDNWYNKLKALNLGASSPFGQVGVDGHANAAWTAANGVSSLSLQKVARAVIGGAMFQTAFYQPNTNQAIDLRKFSTGDYINPASLANQSLADFAKNTQGQARFAKVFERVQAWATSATAATRGKQELDVDLDGAVEYLLFNSRIFAVFEAKGGRMTAAWLRDPATGKIWQVAGNFASYANTETDVEGPSNFVGTTTTLSAYRTSGFKDWWATGGTFGGGNNNAVNSDYSVAPAGDAGWTFTTSGIAKTISLPDAWSGNISAAYTLSGPNQLYVRFGLAPNLLDLMKNGHANLGNEQVTLDNKRVNLVNNASGDGPVRAFVQASANSSINAGASDKDSSGFTTINRRNQAQTHQVEVAITGNTTVVFGFDQGTDLTQPTDSDNDGMDDSWEIDNFGDLNRDGTDDADGDGLTDRQEFILLSNPNNAASGRPIVGVSPVSGGFDVTFPTQSGRNYQVQSRDDLASGTWTSIGTPISGNGSNRTYTDETSLTRRFYRVVVSKP
jgi:hypothetical protein